MVVGGKLSRPLPQPTMGHLEPYQSILGRIGSTLDRIISQEAVKPGG
jgi:hypothetical protein